MSVDEDVTAGCIWDVCVWNTAAHSLYRPTARDHGGTV